LLCAEKIGCDGGEVSVIGADRLRSGSMPATANELISYRPATKFGDDFDAGTLNDCDPGERRRTKRQRQDRFVRRWNCYSIRRNKSVEAGNDEIKDLWHLTPMLGIDPVSDRGGSAGA
jgi:hypothetical protein